MAKSRSGRLPVFALLLSDLLLALLAWEGASVAQSIWGHGPLSHVSVVTIVPSVAAWIGLRAVLGLYPGYGLGPVEELRRQTYAVAVALAATVVFGFALHFEDLLSRMFLVSGFLGLLLLAPVVRHFVKLGLLRMGSWGKPVVVIGSGEFGGRVVRLLQEEWALGYRPVALYDSTVVPADGGMEGVPYKGTVMDATSSELEQEADTAIFAMPHVGRELLAGYVRWASARFGNVMIVSDLGDVTNSGVVARDLAGTFAVEIRYNLLNPWALRAKRLLDLALALVGGALVFPLLLALGALVWLESGGPVFYTDRRTGQDGRLFSCLKFRTMVPDAEALLQRVLKENDELREEYAQFHKLRDDPRVTRAGRLLRKTSLDELPQLWNVLRGEMSLVGPRPYLPRESGDIGETQGEILRVPPGITGPWQVTGRNATSFGDRVEMDAYYVRDWSVWLDVVLLARTVRTVLFGGGAY